MWILAGEPKDQRPQRRVERRPAQFPLRIRPAARDQLTVPAQDGLGLDWQARPRRPRERTAQQRKQRPIRRRQSRPPGLPTQHSQLVPQQQEIKFLRPPPPRQQPHQREHVSSNQIHKRPEQPGPSSADDTRGRNYPAQTEGEPRTSLRTLCAWTARQTKDHPASGRREPRRKLRGGHDILRRGRRSSLSTLTARPPRPRGLASASAYGEERCLDAASRVEPAGWLAAVQAGERTADSTAIIRHPASFR
jgi:hypothetical protein